MGRQGPTVLASEPLPRHVTRTLEPMLADSAETRAIVTLKGTLRTVAILLGSLLSAPEVAAQPEDPPRLLEATHPCARATPGPRIDPIAGDFVGRDSLLCLPSGRHLGAALDTSFNRVISQQMSGGGIAFFDPVRLSSHGRSWQQTRFHLNGIEITDPARPGEPLFELPYDAWDGLTYRSLWTARPGVDLRVGAEAPTTWRLSGATGQDVGGGSWIPRGLLDREPATEYGAPPERRRLRAVGELFAERGWRLGDTGRVRLVGSFVEHEHRYPTLRENDDTNAVDRARRGTFALRHQFDDGRTLISTTVVGQVNTRSHEGAQNRWERPLTLDTTSQAWGAHLKWARPEDNVAISVGVTTRRDDERARDATPRVHDLESTWMYLARPRDAEDLERTRLDLAADWAWRGWQFRARGAGAGMTLDVHSQPRQGVSYLRGPAHGLPAAQVLELATSRPRHELWGREARMDVERTLRLRNVTLEVIAALDHAAAGARRGPHLGYWSPAVGAAMRTPCGGAECFALIRHEPLALTREVSEFLSPVGASTTHVWRDDGDLVPEPGEAGPMLARHGGAFHAMSETLARPSQSHFTFGLRTPRLGPFRGVIAGVGRWMFQRYTVRLSDPSLYSPIEVHTAAGQPLTAYSKDIERGAEETYVLVNDEDGSRYLGVEIQLHSEATQNWFMNLSASGYHAVSNAPFGSFADRNDPGAIDEVSADPNARLNERGRPDYDRAYGATLLLGGRLAPNLWLSTTTRYLDGQPFARIDVVEALPQGPTAVMATQRGTPGPRHTFHMTTDARLSYLWHDDGQNRLSFVLDVFNLLGSGTEIAEDPRTGGDTFRRALEMIPGRALLLTVGWQGPFQ